ncbi:Hypothetical protein R9X50_00330700 [Acrodontium crateriforme]|uniref:Sugar phosphate transporter domain-containing protein n=1 Tax=Acrodontium crateriforme TaxID=150365 RepID=A0AAQ3RBR4_9PEZI|nr:Hypothetical protein R9X50_00330700 [Acrodontium crateriforme]
MADDALHNMPTHRRRSSSVLQVAGGMYGKQKHAGATDAHEHEAGASSSDMEMEGVFTDDEVDGADDDEETGLTHAERRQRDRQRRRNMQLDTRIASNDTDRGEEQQLTQAALLRDTIINALLIGLWYSFSISISVYNKWMFSEENLNFHFPLFTTSLHMLIQFSLATLVLYCFPHFRPRQPESAGYSQLDGSESHSASNPPAKPLMSGWFYLTRIGPCGTATALDIGLGNFSLRFISLTFFTMCKSSVLGFVLLFAFIFQLEKPTWRLCLVILLMTVGVVMMVAGEAAFRVDGFILVMTASFCSGFRWSLTQILLLRNPATSNPFSSIFFLTPVMFAALFILAIPIEGPANVIDGWHSLAEAKGAFSGTLLLFFPGCLAFFMVAAEFALLKRTSVVTLSVCGIFKEVLTISVAGFTFGDELSPINISGLVVTIASIAAYNYIKYDKMKKGAQKEKHDVLGHATSEGPSLREFAAHQNGTDDDDEDVGHQGTSGNAKNQMYCINLQNCRPHYKDGKL